VNLADSPAHAEVLAELREQLERLQAEVGDHPYTGPDSPHPEWNLEALQQHSGGR
jgi:hypothetical protein